MPKQSKNVPAKIARRNISETVTEASKSRVSQSDVPSLSLEKALRVATCIGENYAYKPVTPLDVATALGQQPTTGKFRTLTGASIAYGLTAGGYNAESIALEPLALRIIRPLTEDGDDLVAKREAVLRPRVMGDFLRKYDSAALPREEIARNVLLGMGVPQDRTADVYSMILENAEYVGFLRKIKDRCYVDLKGTAKQLRHQPTTKEVVDSEEEGMPPADNELPPPPIPLVVRPEERDTRQRRVFVTHGKNRALIEPIKKLLTFGDLEAVVSVQSQTVSQPVPFKVMEEMRSCGAAIIHVEGEESGQDSISALNPNVLIEIGAAMALYGQRFILVVKDGCKLPSNLQGLLELRYRGDTLDVNDTVALLDAIADMKKRALP